MVHKTELAITDRHGVVQAELPDAVLNSVTWTLNDSDQVVFTLSSADAAIKAPQCNVNEVLVRIDDSALVVPAIILDVQSTPASSQFTCPGVYEYVRSRFVLNTSYDFGQYDSTGASIPNTGVEQQQIAAQMLLNLQSGTNQSFNIGVAPYATSNTPRYRQYDIFDHQNLYDILAEFATLVDAAGNPTGFDFSVETDGSGNRLWTPYFPAKGITHTDRKLEWSVNVNDYKVSESGKDVATRAYCTGGSNGDIKFENYFNDVAASAALGLEWQAVFADPQENDVNVLLGQATTYVAQHKSPIVTPTLTAVEVPDTLLGVLKVGDSVRSIVHHGRYDFDDYYRIQKIVWTPGTQALEIDFLT